MASATCRALLLTALLAVAAPSIAGAGQAMDREGAGTQTHAGGSDGPDQTGPRDDSPTYQTLSTLGALTLGVLGLLWVRRHTARL